VLFCSANEEESKWTDKKGEERGDIKQDERERGKKLKRSREIGKRKEVVGEREREREKAKDEQENGWEKGD